MFGPEGPISDKALGVKRAAKCAKCTRNEKGDWTRFFVVPLSRALKGALKFIKNMGLETPYDSDLRVCTACDCPCGLKVWARLDHILKYMPKENYEKLVDDCWVRIEQK